MWVTPPPHVLDSLIECEPTRKRDWWPYVPAIIFACVVALTIPAHVLIAKNWPGAKDVSPGVSSH